VTLRRVGTSDADALHALYADLERDDVHLRFFYAPLGGATAEVAFTIEHRAQGHGGRHACCSSSDEFMRAGASLRP
jgi:hypothetical protein